MNFGRTVIWSPRNGWRDGHHPDANLLGAFLEGQLEGQLGRSTRDALQNHLTDCPSCRSLAACANVAHVELGLRHSPLPVSVIFASRPAQGYWTLRWAPVTAAAAVAAVVVFVSIRPALTGGDAVIARRTVTAAGLMNVAPVVTPAVFKRGAKARTATPALNGATARVAAPEVGADTAAVLMPPTNSPSSPAATRIAPAPSSLSSDSAALAAALSLARRSGFANQAPKQGFGNPAHSSSPGDSAALQPVLMLTGGPSGISAAPESYPVSNANYAAPESASYIQASARSGDFGVGLNRPSVSAFEMGLTSGLSSGRQVAAREVSTDVTWSSDSGPYLPDSDSANVTANNVTVTPKTSAPSSSNNATLTSRVNAGFGWILSRSGHLAHSIGSTMRLSTASDLNSRPENVRLLAMPGGDDMWAAGDTGDVFLSHDGGLHWMHVELPGSDAKAPVMVQSISFKDNRNAVLTCSDGRTWKSSDGGQHWQADAAGAAVLP